MTDDVEDAQVVPTHDPSTEGKIKCPKCRDGYLTDVLDSRPTVYLDVSCIRRRRRCQLCRARSTTYEVAAATFEHIIRVEGAKHQFALRIVELIDSEVRAEIVRRLTNESSEVTITPSYRDIE